MLQRILKLFKHYIFRQPTPICYLNNKYYFSIVGDSWVLTLEGPMQVQELVNFPCSVVVQGEIIPILGFQQVGKKYMTKVTTYRGQHLTCTDDALLQFYHSKQPSIKNFTSVQDLNIRVKDLNIQQQRNGHKIIKKGTKICIGNNSSWNQTYKINNDLEDLGWLIGWVVGDGHYKERRANIQFFERDLHHEARTLAWRAFDITHRLKATDYVQSRVPTKPCHNERNGGFYTVASVKIALLCQGLVESGSKIILPSLEKQPYSFQRGFVQGFFGADGSQEVCNGSMYVKLYNTNLHNLHAVQRILQRYGVMSSINQSKGAGISVFENKRVSITKLLFQLCIFSTSLTKFYKLFGFGCARKNDILERYVKINQYTRILRPSHFTTEFKDRINMGE
eukprot:TRINITY_DN26102_c0_g1_i4.p1 TRINITY_DN26102_c0_g1~~TRINITY_DN26102_c0_g1_i4.p1  ORF type:complete len:393 (-),score=-2.54 TRINITY_DN26102_c0_g1_i4:281-1459(-)